jgi:hypothetical protein
VRALRARIVGHVPGSWRSWISPHRALSLPLTRRRVLRPAGWQVVVPIVVDTLEWMLSSPPPLHQFDESPIIVELPETGTGGH